MTFCKEKYSEIPTQASYYANGQILQRLNFSFGQIEDLYGSKLSSKLTFPIKDAYQTHVTKIGLDSKLYFLKVIMEKQKVKQLLLLKTNAIGDCLQMFASVSNYKAL